MTAKDVPLGHIFKIGGYTLRKNAALRGSINAVLLDWPVFLSAPRSKYRDAEFEHMRIC